MSKKTIDLNGLATVANSVAATLQTVSSAGAELLWTDRMAIGQKEGTKNPGPSRAG